MKLYKGIFFNSAKVLALQKRLEKTPLIPRTSIMRRKRDKLKRQLLTASKKSDDVRVIKLNVGAF